MKRQILFVLFILFILSGYAQERIAKGHVLDESNKEGLDSALSTVFDTNLGTTLRLQTNYDLWYMPGPGAGFEVKFLIGGIF